ncbi:MAG: tRNA lysidine(34) synthetase TilS [Alphaproteobacteria bacterium PA2]|nr:MAG: tRNA lysidine(34) synthetase TilS [Alphaproteobacteria bacterium PA2]
MSGLTEEVHRVLDRRLAPRCKQPLALALSGGGDSVALALTASTWARAHGRPLLCLTVDHGLNPASRGWTETCRDLAGRLGADFQALAWTGPKPSTGLPAAARLARHRLLAEAARQAGASVILMGHTASDLAESAAMRQDGSTTPDARSWSPSPVWPDGRGVFLLRPLLGVSRSDLRAWLKDQNAPWIDDPANEDTRFARSRARQGSPSGEAPASRVRSDMPRDLALSLQEDCGLVMSRGALRAAPFDAAVALTGLACVCAGGGERLPRRDRLARLAQALRGPDDVTMTLSGCQVLADEDVIRWIRPAGEVSRSGSPDLHLQAGQSGVWDGRFEIAAPADMTVSALAGHMSSLSPAVRAGLATVHPAARGGLPWFGGDLPPPGTLVASLVLRRFQAAAGLVDREPVRS